MLWPDQESRQLWRDKFTRHGLTIMADLRSELHGMDYVEDKGPVLRGTLAGLERGQTAAGPAFEALGERVATLFNYTPNELRRVHIEQAPVELVIELERLGRTLNALNSASEWEPRHLPRVLDYLPQATPLGLYDRGPNWLYAALALYAHSEPLYQFDVRLGWVTPPQLIIGRPTDAPLQCQFAQRSDHIRVELRLTESYLDYAEAEGLCVPKISMDTGIVLSGKLPLWLWTAVSLAYRDAPWLGIYQPQLGRQAVIVQSRVSQWTVGQLVSSAAVSE